MTGCGDGSNASNWREMFLPQGTYLESIASSGNYAYGIDQDKNLWEWAAHPINNKDGEPTFYEARDSTGYHNSTPLKIAWFKNN